MKSGIDTQYDVLVVGGGASGMMAAGRAAARGKRVLLLEKNKRLGEKLRITGGERCNITNAELDARVLLSRYGDAEQFLYSPFATFGVPDTFTFFEALGLPLVVQGLKRAFPKTEKATDVVRALEGYLRAGGVVVETGSPVSHIRVEQGKVVGVEVRGRIYTAHTYVLATGGVSHPETGSTGDGFNWLRALGHTVVDPTPTIVPLRVKDAWVKHLAGVALPSAKITFFENGEKRFMTKGKMLFTHFGLSGPAILNSAGRVGDLLHEGEVTATIDLFPELDIGGLEKKLIELFDTNKNKMVKNVLSEIMPSALALTILEGVRSVPETKVHSVTKEERKALVLMCKKLTLTVQGLMGYDRAVVADGGVVLDEVDTKTMRSKKIFNLFLTGDLLHITRPSGGYSLQLCWTTGYVAGENC